MGGHCNTLTAVPARARRDGERRQITALTCMPSMLADDEMDPEDWQETVAAFRARASTVIAPLDGLLGDAPGDGVLALFGLDRAREDDALARLRKAGGDTSLFDVGAQGWRLILSMYASVSTA